jgi:hypothetical protein
MGVNEYLAGIAPRRPHRHVPDNVIHQACTVRPESRTTLT